MFLSSASLKKLQEGIQDGNLGWYFGLSGN